MTQVIGFCWDSAQRDLEGGMHFSGTQGAHVLIGKMDLGACLRKLGIHKTGLCLRSDGFLLSGRQGMGYPVDDNSQKHNANSGLKATSDLNPVDCQEYL